ncbi:MAG: 3-isopropylmalate dehydrogenase [Arenicellales bacterium WSBS_2016_MAG_OTU3]
MKKIAVLPGDGIGVDVCEQAKKVITCLSDNFGFAVQMHEAPIGGAAYDISGSPLPEETLAVARECDAVLLGAVGGPKWEPLDISVRPERGLLGLRQALGLFSNLRPAVLYNELADASTLKPEIVAGLDIMIIRELTGGIYFGQPRGVSKNEAGERVGVNTLTYNENEVARIARSGFEVAMKRGKKLTSVDKANVLECMEMWREVVLEVAKDYPDVELSHLYVDNAAMQLVRAPKQFDVIVTTNMFGDILSDCAAMLTGSIGMLPSASLDANGKGMYEPVHGSAPDIAGQNKANPLAMILSVGMMLRYTFAETALADRVETAVKSVLQQGFRTGDIFSAGKTLTGTVEMGDAVVAAIVAA